MPRAAQALHCATDQKTGMPCEASRFFYVLWVTIEGNVGLLVQPNPQNHQNVYTNNVGCCTQHLTAPCTTFASQPTRQKNWPPSMASYAVKLRNALKTNAACILWMSAKTIKAIPPRFGLWHPHKGRLLKVIFIYCDGQVHLRSAYDADATAQRIYNAKAR